MPQDSYYEYLKNIVSKFQVDRSKIDEVMSI